MGLRCKIFLYQQMRFIILNLYKKNKVMLQENLQWAEDISQSDVPSKNNELERNQQHIAGNLLPCPNDEKMDQEQGDSDVFSMPKQNKKAHTSQFQRQRRLQLLLSAQSAIFAPKNQCQLFEYKLAEQSKAKEQSQIIKYSERQDTKKQMSKSSKKQVSWRSIVAVTNVFKHENRICYQVELKNKQIIKVESFNLHRFCPKLVLEFYQKYPSLVRQS